MRDTSFLVSPIPDHAFFKKPVFQHLLGKCFLEIAGLGTKPFYLIAGGLACRIAGKPLLASFKKLFRPTVIQTLSDAFTPTQCGDAFLAAKSIQHNADLLFR